MKKKKKVRRVVSKQKIFCFISFIFILTCCFWYGGRFVYFYLDNKKATSSEQETFGNHLKLANHKESTFRKDGDIYYFYQDAKNNYLIYSNLIWRIVRINKDESITLVSNDVITNLAYGLDDISYEKSPIVHWMNKDDTDKNNGMLEKNLNDISNYLIKNSVCTDTISDIEKITCNSVNDDYYLGLLSVEDYVKTGGKKSFVNNGQASYLANLNSSDKVWYVDNDGALNQSLGDDILGVKVTITLSPSLQPKSGSGTEEDPYVIEDKSGYLASYVKLGDDIWRVYDVLDDSVKLVLNDYAKDAKGEKLQSVYSNTSYMHNDTIYGSVAYYLNHTYLNGLSYKNNILNGYYYNGYYGEETEYGLKEIYAETVDTKIYLPSIGDITFKNDLDNYFIATGIYKKSPSVYLYKSNGINTKKVTSEAYVVPCITINKSILKNGNGTKDNPYTME